MGQGTLRSGNEPGRVGNTLDDFDPYKDKRESDPFARENAARCPAERGLGQREYETLEKRIDEADARHRAAELQVQDAEVVVDPEALTAALAELEAAKTEHHAVYEGWVTFGTASATGLSTSTRKTPRRCRASFAMKRFRRLWISTPSRIWMKCRRRRERSSAKWECAMQ